MDLLEKSQLPRQNIAGKFTKLQRRHSKPEISIEKPVSTPEKAVKSVKEKVNMRPEVGNPSLLDPTEIINSVLFLLVIPENIEVRKASKALILFFQTV